MTPTQVLIVSMIGGFATVVCSLLVVGLTVGLHRLFKRAAALLDVHRTRRANLDTCRAIYALGTTNEPQE
ncbi:hypothetical protein [Streptomyces umbrinus]|uniref:hypothetical protein n=1 Tax=Streptomyces umbrinus TaxID=67370 RepID=UPI0034310706